MWTRLVDLNHEEHVERAQPRRLHRKEVGGEDPRGLVSQELGPVRQSCGVIVGVLAPDTHLGYLDPAS